MLFFVVQIGHTYRKNDNNVLQQRDNKPGWSEEKETFGDAVISNAEGAMVVAVCVVVLLWSVPRAQNMSVKSVQKCHPQISTLFLLGLCDTTIHDSTQNRLGWKI